MKVNLISIVINCFNSETYLAEAINSALFQKYEYTELILIDNHSTDRTSNIIKSYIDSRIKYYKTPYFMPLGMARNFALSKANGEFIAFLDSDDLWVYDKLFLQHQFFIKNKKCDFIYSNYKFLYDSTQKSKLAFAKEQPEGYIFKSLVKNYNIAISTVIIRSIALNNLTHLFSDNYSQIEEFDLFARLLYKTTAAYIHKPLAFYRIHQQMNTLLFPEKGIHEYRTLLDSFKNMDPNFELNNNDLFIHINAKYLCYVPAKNYILNLQLLEARSLIYEHKFYDLKNLLIFLISFLPKSLVNLFISKFR